MKDLVLSPRLKLLASWVQPGAKVADVGTDLSLIHISEPTRPY